MTKKGGKEEYIKIQKRKKEKKNISKNNNFKRKKKSKNKMAENIKWSKKVN